MLLFLFSGPRTDGHPGHVVEPPGACGMLLFLVFGRPDLLTTIMNLSQGSGLFSSTTPNELLPQMIVSLAITKKLWPPSSEVLATLSLAPQVCWRSK